LSKEGERPAPQVQTAVTIPARFGLEAQHGLLEVTLDFASKADILLAEQWTMSPSVSAPELRMRALDAVEFAQLAAKRWRTYERDGAWADCLNSFSRMLEADPEGEFCFFLALKASGETPNLLGKIMVRRTWCHHLFVDFLYTHPDLAGKKFRVAGVGKALLLGVCALAKDLKVPLVWAEATKGSHAWYEDLLGCKVEDFFFIKRRKIASFARELKELCLPPT
jgi:hypothetical protein